MTQALLVPLVSRNEKITGVALSGNLFMGLKLLVAARPSISRGPQKEILLETKAQYGPPC